MLEQGRAAVLNADSGVNSTTLPAAAGSQIAVYLTGLGAVSLSADGLSRVASTVTATIGGQNAPVAFAGLAPGYMGLYQVNLIVPQLARGDYPLSVTTGGAASNTAIVSVQ
jgi:adhesin/invasin